MSDTSSWPGLLQSPYIPNYATHTQPSFKLSCKQSPPVMWPPRCICPLNVRHVQLARPAAGSLLLAACPWDVAHIQRVTQALVNRGRATWQRKSRAARAVAAVAAKQNDQGTTATSNDCCVLRRIAVADLHRRGTLPMYPCTAALAITQYCCASQLSHAALKGTRLPAAAAACCQVHAPIRQFVAGAEWVCVARVLEDVTAVRLRPIYVQRAV
jgi:hypothetical protein